MPWVRFDDQFPIHRKVDGLTDAAYRLHTSAIFWCARNLTDGHVSEEDLDGVTARVRTPSRFAAECVRRGLWHLASDPCPSENCAAPVDSDGWVIHDYLEFQFSKDQVKRKREKNARDQKTWRERHKPDTKPLTEPLSKRPPTRPDPYKGSAVTDPARGRPAQQDPKTYLNGQSTPAERHPSARSVQDAIAAATPRDPP